MSSWRSWHRPLVVFSAVMALWALVSAVGLVVDDRVLVGAPIWAKPFKFTVSLAAYGLTLAWMLTHLTRGRRAGWWAGNVVVLTSLVEMTIITVQVVRGKRSHFNAATPLDTALFSVMGITIIVLWAATLAIGILLLRASIADRAAAWAIRGGVLIALVGAGLGFLMTLPSAEQQAAGNLDTVEVIGAHSVGVPDGGPAMPLTGWSTTGGDLRAPHFVGMHALQLIPLFLIALVLLAPRLARLRDAGVRLRLVRVATAGYAGLVALTTWQALRGQSLIHPDAATLMAAGVLLAAVAAGVWGRCAPRPDPHPYAQSPNRFPTARSSPHDRHPLRGHVLSGRPVLAADDLRSRVVRHHPPRLVTADGPAAPRRLHRPGRAGLPGLWTAVSSPDIDTFRELAALAEGAGALWAQVIAWDLLIGQWMFLQARKLGFSPWLMGPCSS